MKDRKGEQDMKEGEGTVFNQIVYLTARAFTHSFIHSENNEWLSPFD